MVKKVLFVSLMLSGLLFSGVAGKCFAGPLDQLEQAKMRGKWYPDQAEAIYKTIVADYPGTDNALEAQKKLVFLFLSTQKHAEAQAALNKLSADFSAHAGLPEALWDIGRKCEKLARHDYAASSDVEKSYATANNTYQQIIQQYPGSSYAGNVQLAVSRIGILSLIKSGEYSAADGAIDSLKTNFAGHLDLPWTLYEIARRYEKSQKYEETENVYQDIITNYPDTEGTDHALSSQKHLVLLNLAMGKNTDAQDDLDKLVEDFSGRPKLCGALYDIASQYEWSKKYQDAKNVYQQVTQLFPGTPRGQKARLDIRKCQILPLIDLGSDSEAQEAVDKLIADFPDNSYLPAVVVRIAEHYYRRGIQLQKEGFASQAEDKFQKATAIYGKVTKELPDSTTMSQTSGKLGERETATPKAWYYAGHCYRKLGGYEKSTACYQKIVDDYAGFRMGWHALFLVGHNYEEMSKAGLISKSEAEAKIKAAYQQLLENHPGCKAAAHAADWLSRHNSK